jgi:hypothetical protein
VASDINWTDGMIVPNFTYLPTDGTGSFNAFNNPGGAVNLVVDVFGYFTPVTVSNAVEVTASPSSVTANGTQTSTISATVLHDGVAQGSDPVDFSVSPSSCGSLSASEASTTSSGGAATVTYTASTTVENCTITATDADYGETGSTTVDQTTPVNSVSTPAVTNDTGTETVAGTDVVEYPLTSTLPLQMTVTVTSPSGVDVPGDTVTFTDPSYPSNACGQLDNPSTGATGSSVTATTGSNGEATVNYYPGSTSGFCDITATESQDGSSTSFVVDQTTSVFSTASLALTADPTTVAANGVATSSLTIGETVTSSTSTSDPVMLLTDSSNPACGTVSPVDATVSLASNGTTATGSFTSTYTSSTTTGTCTVYAVEAGNGAMGSVSIAQTTTGEYTVSVTASPSAILGNGAGTSTVTVDVTSANGSPVSGATVTETCTPSTPTTYLCGTTTPGVELTGSNGEATFTYTSGSDSTTATSGDFVTLTFTASSNSTTLGSGTVTITQELDN